MHNAQFTIHKYLSYFSSILSGCVGGHLDFDTEFARLERVLLCHGCFRAVEAIQNELTEELAANRVPCVNADFLLVIEEIQLVGSIVGCEVDVLAEFDGSLRAEDDGLAVTPCAESVWREPIDAEIE